MMKSMGWTTLLLAALVVAGGCGGGGTTVAGVESKNVAYQWSDATLKAISATRLGPPATARALGIVHTAMYDAWAAYDLKANGTRTGGSLRRPVSEHLDSNKQKAISYAAYRVLCDLYPTQKTTFDQTMARLGYSPTITAEDVTKPEGIGNRVGRLIIEFRHNDGSNQLNNYADTSGYVPVNSPTNVVDPSRWQPLTFANGATPGYIAPHWGNVIPFSMSTGSQLRPSAPPAFGGPTYMAQLEELLEITSNLNDRQKVIAEYWADGPSTVLPPGHWFLFAQWISDRDNHTLDEDVKMLFMLGNGMMDASIACWDAKRAFDTSRPITAIRHFKRGQQVRSFISPTQGFGMVDGANWLPYQSPNFITPPFPEYTSGHSTYSSVGAELLKRFTKSDRFGMSVTLPAGFSTFEPNVPAQPVTLSWDTFTQAAEEAGISRLYGGIHFQAGNLEGQRCGRQVADLVWRKANDLIEGRDPGVTRP